MEFKLSLLTIILGVLVAVNIFFIFGYSNNSPADISGSAIFNASQAYVLPLAEPSYIPILNSNVKEPAIDAKSALIYDTRSGRYLFEKDPTVKLPIASLTKILTAVVVLENLNLNDIVLVPQSAVKVDGEKKDLYPGEKISLENLFKLMLVGSSNDAAFAVASHANTKGIDLISKMNEKAALLEMLNSKFIDPAGLSDEAYSTPQDLLKLIRYSMKYNLIWSLSSEKTVAVKSNDGKIEHIVQNTNTLLGTTPYIIGGKTGYTDGALGCLVLIVDVPGKNDNLISIVLGSKERFTDMEKLVNWAKEAYRWE